jgi:putative sigma-54 modulation protein
LGIGYNSRFHSTKRVTVWCSNTGVDSVQIRLSTRHGTLSDETQAKITAKLEKLGRLFERLTLIEVTVDLEHRDAPSVDLKVSAEHKHDFVAAAEGTELMAAIDIVIHKLEQQLRKYKQKIQDHHRSTPAREGEVQSEQGPAAD